ncbi:response regulator [Planctomycetes bacterium K23_9]|uniref:Hydrogenase transcriptional regulatory protein hupR1 n=1 Tax=Stieleria marina TaxID=1930275 RepID=A0A517NYJ4_9BACT|nr:Hydrogenase transcriptional regulatory protein hupR1 [Planctomycetes bacterium K23_9]
MSKKVLLVDDEPNVLSAFKRNLRKSYDLEIAVGGEAALQLIKENGPFAVIVSDMQMPEMSGVELLTKVRQINDQTVRVMLTGNADQKTAVDAVNEGEIFRFLSKPCPPDELAKVLDAGLEHYRLITAEAELLNKTLSGSVSMLTQVLSLAMPEAFGLTQEARTWAKEIAKEIGIGPLWQVEMAAMLMRVGCVSLPKDALDAYLSGSNLSGEHANLVAQTPKLGHSLISSIPRLETVASFVLAQNDPLTDSMPIAARILRAIGDYQLFRDAGSEGAFSRLRNAEVYDQAVVTALEKAVNRQGSGRDISLVELRDGMILSGNICDHAGRILVRSGMDVHQAMIQKLLLLQPTCGVQEPISVRLAEGDVTLVDAVTVAQEVSLNIFQEE